MQVEVRVQVPGRCEDVESPARRCVDGEQTREAELSGHGVWHTVGLRVPRRRPVAGGGGGGTRLDAGDCGPSAALGGHRDVRQDGETRLPRGAHV